MTSRAPQSKPPSDDYRVNFFRPRPGYMRQKVTYIWVLLTSWTVFTFGFQLLLAWTSRTPEGEGLFTDLSIFGFPFHFWYSGHFLIVWFIVLCFLFNTFVDRLTQTYRPRK
ncbi:putative solute:sodium symporter small subunit [Geoalkalibacter ferrihydriticus]|uniref:Putative solute:sodium symporter small subunit n=1 Tax=Geoalkalibacter ferrihydriticus TaxID=392333 RepID=A0A1G9IKW5_9BACT|nr:DUF4212 domain-containing protein [Geoalkalibacter ferrihydriticus]SDL25898.1 putative solute:sodium symporter small subunit [Geoalkalibacter ferrihydriticus]